MSSVAYLAARKKVNEIIKVTNEYTGEVEERDYIEVTLTLGYTTCVRQYLYRFLEDHPNIIWGEYTRIDAEFLQELRHFAENDSNFCKFELDDTFEKTLIRALLKITSVDDAYTILKDLDTDHFNKTRLYCAAEWGLEQLYADWEIYIYYD